VVWLICFKSFFDFLQHLSSLWLVDDYECFLSAKSGCWMLVASVSMAMRPNIKCFNLIRGPLVNFLYSVSKRYFRP
ncbi:MAG: hypothetical protein LLF94_00080, partial [Chlamydiales bacterium]|nr:hypothetical protein [Chlamydiales bacterium]